MKNSRQIVLLIGIALCAVAYYVGETGRVFGAFINRFAQCTDAPGNSFPCYGIYDISLMVAAAILGAIFLGMLLWNLYKDGLLQSTQRKLFALSAVALLVLVGGLVIAGYRSTPSVVSPSTMLPTDLDWIAYKDDTHNFSFDYPEDGLVETWQDTRFLRVQNYDPQDTSFSMTGKYWVEFFIFTTNNTPSTCPQSIENYDTINVDGVTIYKGESSGPSGILPAVCIDRGNHDLYAQGQDGTGENILERIFDSIGFAE